MEFEITVPEGTAPEIAELFKKPEVLSIVQHVNKGVAAKNKELLDQLSLTKKELNDLGGVDGIKQRMQTLSDLEAERARLAAEQAEGSNDVETVKKAYQDKLDVLAAERDALKQEKVATKVTSQITKALGDDAEAFEVLEPFIMKRIKSVVQADGSVALQVMTAEGGPLLTEKGDATIKDLINEFRNSAKFAPLFKATNLAGSGARTTTTVAATANPFAKGTPAYSPTAQALLFRSDPAKARQFAAAAGVKLYE